MRLRLRHSLLPILLACAVVPAQARAQDASAAAATPLPPLAQALTGEARADYESAILLYQDGDFAGASLKFQRAYVGSKDARLLWNAGASEKQLRHYAKTYLLVSKYLREAAVHLTKAEKDEASGLLRTIESFVSHVTVTARPEGTELSIDDTVVTTLPASEPIVADMGTRRFKFHKAGFKDVVLMREVVGGAPLTLDAALEVESKEGNLRVTAEPGNTIRIDGRVAGTGEWQGALPAGVHTLSVDGPDRKPYRTEVAVETGQLTTLRIGLEPVSKAEKSKFVAWPWVAGGVGVVAAVGIGAYFALAPDKPGPPSAAPGTIKPGYWTLSY